MTGDNLKIEVSWGRKRFSWERRNVIIEALLDELNYGFRELDKAIQEEAKRE